MDLRKYYRCHESTIERIQISDPRTLTSGISVAKILRCYTSGYMSGAKETSWHKTRSKPKMLKTPVSAAKAFCVSESPLRVTSLVPKRRHRKNSVLMRGLY